MSEDSWLDPVRASLDARRSPVRMFIRDDDAGWGDDDLFRLLEIVDRYRAPVDLAAIPAALTPPVGRELRERVKDAGGRVTIHQHGFAHVNHEAGGRNCEFGPSRTIGEQRHDLVRGRHLLEDVLGAAIPPIFTPPWNRCTTTTAACLGSLRYRVLSRDVTAGMFGIAGVAELPVHLDWTGRRGARTGATPWGIAIADRIRAGDGPVGLMLHHAAMNADDRRMLGRVLAVLTAHPNVLLCPMAACVEAPWVVGRTS